MSSRVDRYLAYFFLARIEAPFRCIYTSAPRCSSTPLGLTEESQTWLSAPPLSRRCQRQAQANLWLEALCTGQASGLVTLHMQVGKIFPSVFCPRLTDGVPSQVYRHLRGRLGYVGIPYMYVHIYLLVYT